jgi:hypothetical protein
VRLYHSATLKVIITHGLIKDRASEVNHREQLDNPDQSPPPVSKCFLSSNKFKLNSSWRGLAELATQAARKVEAELRGPLIKRASEYQLKHRLQTSLPILLAEAVKLPAHGKSGFQ